MRSAAWRLASTESLPPTLVMGLPSVAYLPATTAPIALSRAGLPIGAQVVGRFGADKACIALADLREDGITASSYRLC